MEGKGTYHFSCGKDVSILELYNDAVKQIGLNHYPEPEIKRFQIKSKINSY